MSDFEVLDISGDVGIKAVGPSLQEAFINASLGMYSLITNLDAVQERKEIDLSIESDSPEGLLVSWLNELIFYFDAYGFIGKKISIKKFSEKEIEAVVRGEEFDPERHEGKLLIKAATYHRLQISSVDDSWEINVIFDI
ncbi:MAG: archease [Nitrospirota bacterium]